MQTANQVLHNASAQQIARAQEFHRIESCVQSQLCAYDSIITSIEQAMSSMEDHVQKHRHVSMINTQRKNPTHDTDIQNSDLAQELDRLYGECDELLEEYNKVCGVLEKTSKDAEKKVRASNKHSVQLHGVLGDLLACLETKGRRSASNTISVKMKAAKDVHVSVFACVCV